MACKKRIPSDHFVTADCIDEIPTPNSHKEF